MKNIIKAVTLLFIIINAFVSTNAQSAKLTVSSDGTKKLITLAGDQGSSYKLFRTTDVNRWNPDEYVTVFTDINGRAQFAYQDNTSHAFYKAVKVVVPQVSVALDSNSPSDRTVQISKTAQTSNVLLARFDIKPQGSSGNLRKIAINLHTEGVSLEKLFGDIMLNISGKFYSADVIQTVSETISGNNHSFDGVAIFMNMTDVIPADYFVSVDVYAKVNQDNNGSLSGTGVTVGITTSGESGGNDNNPVILNDQYQTMKVVSSKISGGKVVFISSEVFISNLSAILGSPIFSQNRLVGYAMKYSVTVTAWNENILLAKDISNALTVKIPIGTSFLGELTASPSVISGDSQQWFNIPAGSSRTFQFTGALISRDEVVSQKTVEILAITTYDRNGAIVINQGLKSLSLTFSL